MTPIPDSVKREILEQDIMDALMSSVGWSVDRRFAEMAQCAAFLCDHTKGDTATVANLMAKNLDLIAESIIRSKIAFLEAKKGHKGRSPFDTESNRTIIEKFILEKAIDTPESKVVCVNKVGTKIIVWVQEDQDDDYLEQHTIDFWAVAKWMWQCHDKADQEQGGEK